MNLRKQILKEHSKSNSRRIAKYIGDDEKRFAELMDLFLHDEYRVVQRSAWIVSEMATAHPHLIRPHLKKMLIYLKQDVHDAVKRNVIRILQFIDIPKNLQGLTAEICFQFLMDAKEPVAVKVFSMTVLSNLCKTNTELKNELRLVIEDQLTNASAGFKARARKVLLEKNNL
jgi:hypothetical protein